jgi:hypothetical protein
MGGDDMTKHCATNGPVLALLALVGFAALVPGVCLAQSGGPYDLTWSTIDGGGATGVTGGIYSLGGTAGQPDAGLSTGGSYSLEGGFWFGGQLLTPVDDGGLPDPAVIPLVNRLHEAAPNPFNPRTQIAFDLARPGQIRLSVYDLRGALVRTLEAGVLPAGRHVRTWDGTNDDGAAMASGTYILTIDAGDFHARQKGVLLK